MRKEGMMTIYPLDSVIATFQGTTAPSPSNTMDALGMPTGHVSLKHAWDRFVIVCLPHDATPAQLWESRRVFYGAIGWIMHALAQEGESVESDEAYIASLEKELIDFAVDMTKGLV